LPAASTGTLAITIAGRSAALRGAAAFPAGVAVGAGEGVGLESPLLPQAVIKANVMMLMIFDVMSQLHLKVATFYIHRNIYFNKN
jgi:hypothetical protein